MVTEDFLSEAPYDRNGPRYQLKDTGDLPGFALPIGPEIHVQDPTTNQSGPPWGGYLPKFIQDAPKSVASLKHLSNQECISSYATRILSGRQNLIAITKERNSSIPVFDHSVTSGSLLYNNWIQANEYINSY